MSEAATINKLIILYILDQIDFPLTNGQITEFVLDQEYMDYITLQETLSGLLNTDLISSKKQSNRTEYRITETGSQTLSYFKDRVSDAIRKDVRGFLKENALSLRDEVSVIADYYRTTGKEYAVRCRILEGNSDLIDMTITVPTEMQAEATAIKWKQKHQEVYAYVMTELL